MRRRSWYERCRGHPAMLKNAATHGKALPFKAWRARFPSCSQRYPVSAGTTGTVLPPARPARNRRKADVQRVLPTDSVEKLVYRPNPTLHGGSLTPWLLDDRGSCVDLRGRL